MLARESALLRQILCLLRTNCGLRCDIVCCMIKAKALGLKGGVTEAEFNELCENSHDIHFRL